MKRCAGGKGKFRELNSGRDNGNASYISGEMKGKSSYIRGRKWECELHSGREKGNLVTSGEGKGKSSYIRGREKGILVTSGGGKREI